MSSWRLSGGRQSVMGVLWLAGMLWLAPAACIGAEPVKSVLVIYGNAELPSAKVFDAALRSTVREAIGHRVEFYTENLDNARFPAIVHQEAFLALLRERYADRKIDVLVSSGPSIFDFVVSQRERILPNVPVVYGLATRERVAARLLPPDVIGVPVDFGSARSIDLALRLHPNARRLVLVTGTGEWERRWEKRLRAETAALSTRLEIEFLVGLPTQQLFERLGELSRDTIVFTPGYYYDGAGAVSTPASTGQEIAARSAAPVYVAYETQVGTGAVGGVITTFEAAGRQTGEIVTALLNGKAPAEVKLPDALQAEPLIDWRQVRRWNINDALLPAGTIVKHREPEFWERYRFEVSIGAAVVLLQAILIVALLVEVRKRHRIATALEESKRSMDLAARAAKLTTWIWDSKRDRFWLAPTNEKTPPEDKPLSLVGALQDVHPADRERVENAARRALASNEDMIIEYRMTASGEPDVRWILAHGKADEHGGQRLLGVAMDVTERKGAELDAERDRAALRHMTRVSLLGQLSASIAHELNQPLATILNNAEAARKMLGRERVDLAELREICNDIVSEDHRAANVIRRLRTLFKGGEMPRQPLDMNELVRDTLALLHTELLMRHVTSVTRLAPSLPLFEGARAELQQVLLNLFVNAADAMERNAMHDRKLVILTDATGADVRLHVTDSGPGIPAADLANIFDPFWSSKPGGMGMGLAICKSIVSAHGGSLTAKNGDASGATFCVCLPLRQSA